MLFNLAGRTYLQTYNNRVGIGPSNARRGDVVCGFYGAKTLYVLRLDENSKLAEFIGDAWLDGYMDLKTTRERGEEIREEFILR